MSANYPNHWKALMASTLGAAAILAPSAAQAQQLVQPQPDLAQAQPTDPAAAQEVAQASGPVTAISELSDVKPTDWAFQALQSLVERYGCIAGYPDRTYRGNRAMTRYEFAAGMNACLDRINELIAAGLADKVSKADLATLQKLQEEFQAELAAVKGRVDKLEGDVKTLQGQVFNPVTKLNVEVIVALQGSALAEDRVNSTTGAIVAKKNQANMTLPYRVRMNFDASFVRGDRLRIRLQARDAETRAFQGDTGFDFGGGITGINQPATFILQTLSYRFPIFGNGLAFVAATGTRVEEIFRYDNAFNAASNFAANNSPATSYIGSSASAATGLRLPLSPDFTVAYAYQSLNTGTANNSQALGNGFGDSGVTGGSSSHGVELSYSSSKDLLIALQFASTYIQTGTASGVNGVIGSGAQNTNLFRGTPSYTVPAGLGLTPPSARVNAFTVAANWTIAPSVLFTGWFTAGTIDYKLPNRVAVGAPSSLPSEDVNGFLVGFEFPDLFLKGGRGGIVAGQPIVSTSSGLYNSRPFVIDVYYTIPVNDRISLTPGAYFISNSRGGNNAIPGVNDPMIGVGALRARFAF